MAGHTNNVAVITGTSRGIGRHLAEYYLGRGLTVIGCSRGAAGIEHERYRHYRADVSDERTVVDLFRDVRARHGKADVLINNAGIASMNHALVTPTGTVRAILETNLFGTFLFCQEAARLMRKQRYGRIVNFATVAAPLKLAGEAAYVASKAGVVGLTEVLARELGSFGITVNAVGPTPIRTDLIKGVPEEKLDGLIRRQAIKRYAEFSDITNVIDFFIAPSTSFVTGQTVYLGGI